MPSHKQSFEIVSEITDIKVIAVNTSIHELARLQGQYGEGRWRKLKGVAMIQLATGRVPDAEKSIGTKRMASAGRNLNASIIWIRSMQTNKHADFRFAICVENSEYPASLEILKVYRVLPDAEAEQDGDLRIVDESGEDYLYPASYFILIDLPSDAAQTLQQSFAHNI